MPNERLGDRRPAGRLVGRDREIDRLEAFVASARTDGGALLVTGEPGVGKTELLDAAAAVASEADAKVLRAAGIQFEAEMSYAGLNQVLMPLVDELPRLPDVHRDALNVALGFGEGAPPSRLIVSNAVLQLLRQAAAIRPLLVVLDDLPWLDRASAGVLSFVARRLSGSSVGLIGASRTETEDFFDHAGLPELLVEPLGEAASRQLLDTRYPDLAPAVRERILIEAQGSPLALLELPAALGPEGRASAASLPSTLPLGRRLQQLFGARIAALPQSTGQLLLRLALDGTGDVRVLGVDEGSNVGLHEFALAEKARLAYLDESTHRVAFHHPLIRSAVVELSPAEERRDAHRVLADAWADQPERRAWHLAEATVEPDESVAALLETAAGRILARGDAVGCVKLLTRSADLSPRHAERRRRMASAAYVGAEVAGDLSNASQVLEALRRGETEVEGSLQAAVAASTYLLQGDGDVATAHRVLVGAIEGRQGILDGRDPVIVQVLHSLLMVCTYGCDEDLWQPFEDAMGRAEGIPPALELNWKTFADPVHAGARALEALESAIAALARESDPAQIIRIGTSAAYVSRVEGCRDALWRVVHDARRGGAVASGITAMIILAWDDFEAGAWDDAERLVDEAIQLCEGHGYQSLVWPCRFFQGVLAAARGDAQSAGEQVDAILQWARPRGMRVGQMWAWRVRVMSSLARGDVDAAYLNATMISPAGGFARHNPHALRVLLDLVEAAVRSGRNAEAAAHVAAMRNANVPALSSRYALVVGGSAAMTAPDDLALELFEATLALPGIERWQWDLARVRLAYGERLRRQRAMVEARVQLSAALAIFERLKAQPWVDRTTAELRATGRAKPHAGDDVLDRLTPQEFEIASLAASGMTNKQIGERLFLSHRTVGGHLHRAFPKLGVATRAALRDALGALPPEQFPRP